jgi:hypothetical protein
MRRHLTHSAQSFQRPVLALCLALVMLPAARPATAQEPANNPAPTASDWAALAELPDWSGVWTPNVTDQFAQMKTNPVPWTPAAAAQIQRLQAEAAAG